MMKLSLGIAGAVALSLIAGPGRADVTMVAHTHMDMPSMRGGASTPAMQAQIDKMSNTTTYISGHKVRTDTAIMSMIVDQDAGKMWFLNNTAHTYTVTTFSPADAKKMAAQMLKGQPGKSKGMTYKVTDTGRTTKVLGHTARHYIVKTTMDIMGKPTTMTQDILAAQDLSTADMGVMGGKGAGQVHGLPLVTTTTYHGGMTEGMTMKQTVTSLTTTPIPASTFALPAGYTKTESQGSFPMGGMRR
ncbi:MAG: DUF4412 domain-containing protein [Capsulimonas sp.]|uniref:DUF4412 domain-containing protein n=1 Tax=Capsulimonas sp. TaxID=2494211 RepID=UPI0032670785